ncbi:MAG: hypothetical protein WA655_22245 [Candidatus Korobacteraceae bacterium]
MPAVPKSGVLNRLYDWLAPAGPPQPCDVIFVLAGRECRKGFGLRLLEEGWANTLLLSVDRFEIRRFSSLKLPVRLDLFAIASAVEPRCRHYFVTAEAEKVEAERITIGRFGTLSEILAFSNWLSLHTGIRSAMIVSSGFHLRRVRMCCRRLVSGDTKLTFVAVPDESRYFRSHWWKNSNPRRLVLSELLKLAIYRMLGRTYMTKPGTTPVLIEGHKVSAGL